MGMCGSQVCGSSSAFPCAEARNTQTSRQSNKLRLGVLRQPEIQLSPDTQQNHVSQADRHPGQSVQT